MQANEDKAMLVESMKKLTAHISNNSKRQLDIFNSLSLPDLQKIVLNLHDSNESLRRISALLLCQLAYRNEEIKKKMVLQLKLFPSQGRICLSAIPSLIVRFPSAIKTCLSLMKAPTQQNQAEKLCWIINLDHKIAKIQYLQFKAYTLSTFVDPNRTIFGFTIHHKNDRTSPLGDRHQANLITPIRLSFNSSPYNRPDLEKTFRHKDKEKVRTETSETKRDKCYTIFQQRVKHYTQR